MKMTATILFLFLWTATQTPIVQLFKLPVLLEHFDKHKQHDGLSLFKFLYDHYSNDHKDADQAEDDQLPFKEVILQGMGSAVIQGQVKIDFSLEVLTPAKVLLVDNYTPQQHLSQIFHPPQCS